MVPLPGWNRGAKGSGFRARVFAFLHVKTMAVASVVTSWAPLLSTGTTKGRLTERTFSALPPSRTVGTPSPLILAFRPHVQRGQLARQGISAGQLGRDPGEEKHDEQNSANAASG